MHELSIAMSIVEMAEEEVGAARRRQVDGDSPETGRAVGRGEGSVAVVLSRWLARARSCRFACWSSKKFPIVVFCAQCQAPRPVQFDRSCSVVPECGTPIGGGARARN